jgi:hypothetical protein
MKKKSAKSGRLFYRFVQQHIDFALLLIGCRRNYARFTSMNKVRKKLRLEELPYTDPLPKSPGLIPLGPGLCFLVSQ